MTYDLANRLKTHAAGNTTTTYTYDGDGVRVQASTGNQASKKTNFVWDRNHGLPQLALERDGNNALLRRYVYGERRISMTTSGAASYYHYDNLGSVANLTSAAGATQWTWAYEPFGATRTEIKASGTQPGNLMKFTGEYHDPTGLYHLRARQYDATTGRFLALDPAPENPSEGYVSPYVYAADRPTVMIDPSGRIPIPCDSSRKATRLAASPDVNPGPGPMRCRNWSDIGVAGKLTIDYRGGGTVAWGFKFHRARAAEFVGFVRAYGVIGRNDRVHAGYSKRGVTAYHHFHASHGGYRTNDWFDILLEITGRGTRYSIIASAEGRCQVP